MKYIELPFNKKLNLLRLHNFGCEWPDLDHANWCLHCGKKFTGHSVRVYQGAEGSLWLECGTPECDGSPIDWAPYPWWDPAHPDTRKNRRKPKGKSKRRSQNPQPPDNPDDIPF